MVLLALSLQLPCNFLAPSLHQVPSDRGSPLPLPVHLLHTVAHIELNAVDLAWDTVVRFAPLGLPDGFYLDFVRQAVTCLICLQVQGSHAG